VALIFHKNFLKRCGCAYLLRKSGVMIVRAHYGRPCASRRSRLLSSQQRRESGHSGTAALGHVWTAPGWQEESSLCSCGDYLLSQHRHIKAEELKRCIAIDPAAQWGLPPLDVLQPIGWRYFFSCMSKPRNSNGLSPFIQPCHVCGCGNG
jgi:hypothetical protein